MPLLQRYLPIGLVTVLVLLAGSSDRKIVDPRSLPRLSVTIVDASGEPTPARIRLTDAGGHAGPLPEQAVAVMYGMWDHADGYGYQPDSAFYVDGTFDVELPAGPYRLDISKGNEYVDIHDTIRVDGPVARQYRLERWIDTASMGWYSADDHIHVRRSPRDDPLLLVWTAAEDVRVGNMLRMGDFWETYYSQYAFGEDGVYKADGYMLMSGQEDPRTPELGHVIGLGASEFVRFPNRYYLYDLVFDGLRASGGIGGYAHQAETFHGYRGLTLDGLRRKVDLVELVQFCAPGGPLLTEHFYHLLNLGIPVTATAGSDFPWCGKPHDGSDEIPVHEKARIGNARFYAYLGDDELSYDTWMDAVRAGRTFATSGPVLFLEVNGRKPGAAIDLAESGEVTIEATAYGNAAGIALESLDLVAHGEVIGTASARDPDQSPERLHVRLTLEIEEGVWIAARAEAGPMQAAHTTPVYVTVGGGGFHHPAALDHLLDRSESYLSELDSLIGEPHHRVGEHAWRYRDGLMERIEAARAVMEHIRESH